MNLRLFYTGVIDIAQPYHPNQYFKCYWEKTHKASWMQQTFFFILINTLMTTIISNSSMTIKVTQHYIIQVAAVRIIAKSREFEEQEWYSMTGYRTNRGHTTLNVNYNLNITEMQSVFIKKWRGQSLINNRDLLITTQLFKLKLMCKDNNSFAFWVSLWFTSEKFQ